MSNKTSDETPQRKKRSVITPKRRYFFPESGQSVEADDLAGAGKLVIKAAKPVEEGDA